MWFLRGTTHLAVRGSALDSIGAPSGGWLRYWCILMTMSTEQWLTADDVAKHLRLSLRTVRSMTTDGRIPSHTLGAGIVRYRASEVDAALAPRKHPGASSGT